MRDELDEIDGLSFAEAVERLRDQMDDLRQQIGALGHRRAKIVAAEVARRGPGSAPRVAEELGLSEAAVRRLVREARLRAAIDRGPEANS